MCVYSVLSILIVFNDYEQKIITKQINNIPSMKPQSWRGGMYNYNIKSFWVVLLLILFSKIIKVICDKDVFATAQVSRGVYTSPSESVHLFRSLLSDIIYSTAIHYIGISEWVNEWVISDTALECMNSIDGFILGGISL